MLALLGREEVDQLARECGFTKRKPKEIRAFEFAVCSALAAVVEGKRCFATIWRTLIAAAGLEVHRSAVTQRIGEGSGRLMETLVERVSQRLSRPDCPSMLERLSEFRAVLAHDGSVFKVSPLLKKLFPARRTTSMDAAARVHGTVDLVHRQFVRMVVTGDRESELAVARTMPVEAGTLYMNDLGYVDYTWWKHIKNEKADLISRLKRNANPMITKVRHGVWAPVRTVQQQYGLNDPALRLCKNSSTFDVDACFKTKDGPLTLRVIGVYNEESEEYHLYATTLSPDAFSANDIAQMYRLRWVIELLFKLLKTSCHMDHVDTSNVGAIRTHIYSSILASLLLSELIQAAAESGGIHPSDLSVLVAGAAFPMIALPLSFLLLGRDMTPEEFMDSIMRLLLIGCRDQNKNRTRRQWGSTEW